MRKYVKEATNSISNSTKTLSTEENFIPKQIRDVAKVSSCMTTEEYMKVNGIKIRGIVVALSSLQMAILIKESIRMEKLTVKVSTPGRMAKFLTDSSLRVRNKDMVSGTASKVTPIWAPGSLIEQTDMAFTPGLMETDMRANGSNAFVVVREPTSSKMATSMSENMQMVFLRVKANTSGKTEITIRVNSKPV